jgi:ABC-type Fe3+-hydroxamate transport system substrate-binding protein
MTDVNQEQVLTKEQKYLQDILAKFNLDQNDPDLTEPERILLGKIVAIEKEANELIEQFTSLNKEVTERQEKMNNINQQLLLKRGQSQGLVESLLALR